MTLPNSLQIFGENRVFSSQLEVSSGALSAENLRDRDPDACWRSSGSSDSAQEYAKFLFRDGAGLPASCAFDRVLLLNTNIKNFSAAYYTASDGTASSAVPELAAAVNTAADALYELAAPAFTPSGFGLFMQTTQTPDAEKRIGGIKLCKHLLTLDALTTFDRRDYAREGSYYLAGGELVRWREFTRFGGTLTVKNLSKTGRDSLWAAYRACDFLTLAFFTDYDLRETYDVAAAAPPQESFDRKTRLYELSLEVKER